MVVFLAKAFGFIGNRLGKFSDPFLKIRDKIIFGVIDKIVMGEPELKTSEEKVAEPIIWVYWAQGLENAPDLVKKCVHELEKNVSNYMVIVLDSCNLKEYVTIADYIVEKVNTKRISQTHFSDIIRINLLAKFGGIWIDSTVLVSTPFSEFVNNEKKIITIPQENITYSISAGKWSAWLLGSKIVSPYFMKMKLFFDAYWEKYNILATYFLIDYLLEYFYRNDENFREDINNCSTIEYSVYDLINLRNQICEESKYRDFMEQHFVNKLNYKLDYNRSSSTYASYIMDGEGW